MIDKQQVLSLYLEVHELYNMTDDKSLVLELQTIEGLIFSKKYEEAYKLLSKMDTEETLLNTLEVKLQGKSVHKTLKKITSGNAENKYEILTGISSLFTHMCIEISKGGSEYKSLLKKLHYKLGHILNLEESECLKMFSKTLSFSKQLKT